MKTVIIFGAKGMLGTYTKLYLNEQQNIKIICFDKNNYDIRNITVQSIKKLFKNLNLKKEQENFVINCSGVIPQSIQDKQDTVCDYLKVNTIFPIVLEKLSKKFHFKLVHISTDCVFDGLKTSGFQEDDEDFSEDLYCVSKSIGEFCESCIIRTSIIGEELYNNRNLLEYFKTNKNKSIIGYDNKIWNGITCLQLAKIIHQIVEQNLIWKGIRHIFSNKSISKYELAILINNVYDLGMDIEKESVEPDKNMTLKTQYPENAFFDIPDLKTQLEEQKQFFENRIFINLSRCKKDNSPFPHVIVDECLIYNYAKEIQDEILSYPERVWDRYENPFERKYTFNKKNKFGKCVSKLFDFFESDIFVEQLSTLFSINLEVDPFRHYWGIHKYKHGDFLNIHADAGIHPKNKKKKHLTLGLYLSKDWKEENNGHLELWTGQTANIDNAKIFECKKSILPIFNRLLLFECNDISWHGNPVPVHCPAGEVRIFVTISYLSSDMSFRNKRERAFFVPRPHEKWSEEMHKLRLTRADKHSYKQAYRTL